MRDNNPGYDAENGIFYQVLPLDGTTTIDPLAKAMDSTEFQCKNDKKRPYV